MTESSRGSIHTLSGAYVVDALDDAERIAFERHLPGCPDCQAEVLSMREAAAMLADDAALDPPPELRDSVLSDIRKIRPLPPETEDRDDGPRSSEPGAEVVPLRPRRFRIATLAVAAAVLAILGIAAVAQPWNDGLTEVEQVMAAGDATRVKVDLPDGSSATVFRSVSEGKAVVVTEDMAKAPSGKVYELWLQDSSGDMVPAGLMKGSGDHKQMLEGDAAESTAAAISVEPSGGSDAPTTEPIAFFEFDDA